MRTCAVILNPRARHGKVRSRLAEIERDLESRLAGSFAVSCLVTQAPEDATRLAREAVRDGVDLVAAVGGDGTLHEVCNGLFEDGRLLRDVPVALLSRGTGGDTRRTLGLPNTMDAFVRMLLQGRTRRIDVGRADFLAHDGRPCTQVFVNIADLGVGGDVVARVNRGSKRLGGFLSFLGSTVAALLRYRPKEVEVRLDDGPAERVTLVILAVANCRYFGGGMHIAPPADPSDGLLDVVTVTWKGKGMLFLNLHRIYSGTHLDLPSVMHRRARRIEARSLAGDILLDMDGEQPGKLPVTFQVLPAALQVCVP